MKNKLTRLNNKPLVLSLAFGLIAATIITVSLAASPNASLEPEDSSNRTNVAVRNDSSASNGQYVQFSSAEDEDAEAPASWQAAFDSRNQNTIDAWYEENTGYDAAPDGEPASLLDLPDDPIDLDWLQANEDGTHVYQEGGRWYLDGVKAGRIRIGVSNLTLRRAFLDSQGSAYTISHWPFWSSGITGTVVEYCTVKGNNSEHLGMMFHAPGNTTNEVTVRNCEMYGVKGGAQLYGGETYEYNYVHDLHFFEGSHNTSMSDRGPHVIIRRNSLNDGNSSALSIYPDNLIYDLLVEENIFNTPNAWYCVNFGNKEYGDQTYDARLINNIFGQKYNPTCGNGVALRSGHFTTISGNVMMDGTPTPIN